MTTLLEINGLVKEYGGRRIIDGLALQLQAGEKAGLIGRNGSGKSTLLKIIAGREEPTRGAVRLHLPPERVGYLPQEPELPRGLTAGHWAAAGVAARWPVLQYLSELGFSRADLAKPVEILSGGEKTRLCLARLRARDCDLLLLDEPANHLDTRALAWLEEYLRAFRGAVLIVSHDRCLLDETADRILELEEGRIRSYPGGYTAYARLKDEENRFRWHAYRNYLRERQKITAALNRRKQYARQAAAAASPRNPYLAARAKKADRRVKATAQRLERLEEKAPRKPWEHRRLRLDFGGAGKTPGRIIRVEDLAHSFGEKVLFAGVSFTVFAGEAVVLVGPNGAGKTTLLRLIRGELEPGRGRIAVAPAVRAGFFGQDDDDLDPEATPLKAVMAAGETDGTAARHLLGALLFSGDHVHRRVSALSGGEKKRLRLAVLLARRANLLLLDEPTNHLDIESREALEAALDGYDGTILAASHDRYFLHRLAGRVLFLEGGRLVDYPGSYGEYLESLKQADTGGAEEILLLENRLSCLAAQLDEPARSVDPGAAAERERLNREFIEISRKLYQLRRRR